MAVVVQTAVVVVVAMVMVMLPFSFCTIVSAGLTVK